MLPGLCGLSPLPGCLHPLCAEELSDRFSSQGMNKETSSCVVCTGEHWEREGNVLGKAASVPGRAGAETGAALLCSVHGSPSLSSLINLFYFSSTAPPPTAQSQTRRQELWAPSCLTAVSSDGPLLATPAINYSPLHSHYSQEGDAAAVPIPSTCVRASSTQGCALLDGDLSVERGLSWCWETGGAHPGVPIVGCPSGGAHPGVPIQGYPQ